MWTVYEMASFGWELGIPCPFSGASQTRFLGHMYDDFAALFIIVGWFLDFEDVHVDALLEPLRMTAPSSVKSTDACHVKVTDEDGFLSPCVGHERANLDHLCHQQVFSLYPNTDAR